jgi:ribosome-binding ATPase
VILCTQLSPPHALGLAHMQVPLWGPLELHRLVAHFLRVRFPILLALNKADASTAKAHITRVMSESGEVCVPTSAASEWQLCQWRRAGLVRYLPGADAVEPVTEALANLPSAERDKFLDALASVRASVLGPFGGTGIQTALDRALSLAPPLCVYPVEDLALGTALHATREHPDVLRDCFLVHPGPVP